jgi:parallel beta-helix repeat protein
MSVEGVMTAKALKGENIYFTSYKDDNLGGDTNKDGTTTAPTSGDWYGISFNNSGTTSLMRRCVVRYAGGGNVGGISTNNSSPVIDSCNISNSYFGIYMQGVSNPVLTNNTIGSSQMTPLAMSFEANPVMSNNTLSFSDNAYDAIGIIGGSLTANAVLKIRSVTSVPNMTYLLLDQITVPSGLTLTINKGITIKSYANGNTPMIIVNGALIANASSDSIINFTSARDDSYGNPADTNKDGTITSPVVGDWYGIIFNTGSSGIMNYCRIKYASVNYFPFSTCNTTEYINNTSVGIIDASPTISNCEFKDLNYAISCYRSASPTLTNNSMVNILYTPINISGPSNPTISGITFTNVGWRAMGLLGGNVCLNGTIKKRDVAGFTNITYVLLSDMTINSGTYVNVEPGVVIKVNNPGSGSSIFVDGGFKTDGTLGQHVVFTSIKDDNVGNPGDSNGDGNASTPTAGDWGSIKYRSTSDDAYCKLNFTDVKYAGNTNEGGVTFENAGGQLKNGLITNTSNYGVYCNGNSTPVVDSLTIQNCNLDPIAISLTSNPNLGKNITFISNKSQAIKIIEGTLSSVASLNSRNVAGINNIAYIVSNLTISSNAKLTIQPGVVIKFRQDTWYWSPNIEVYGNLIAKGTPSNKIYFTSLADDSKGGDSNNDGNATSPVKGDWGNQDYYGYYRGGVHFINNSLNADTVNSMKNCEISYAGYGIRIENSHATIDSCLIQLCSNYGATVLGSANPAFNNCQFYNISNSPVELSMFSNPTFTNCSALNVGLMALSVIPEVYSQSATMPIRNFGGYNNITYYMEGVCTINSGTTITIPSGLVFKSASANGFTVNGGLNILGTSKAPVTFTNTVDDNFGNPMDTNQDGTASKAPDGYNQGWSGSWIAFNDVSDDASSINHLILKYGNTGITTLSASPSIKNVRFENLYLGVDMNGVSAPKIDSCVFNNLQYSPMQISLVSYPVSTVGNVISGTTYKVIKVRDEVLTKDITLPKRNFGGKNNIPYFFHNYQIGTSATLTISPGVICKFQKQNYWDITSGIGISRGLIALGGSTPDSIIVFTSILDDFYGGDSNSDSTATKPGISNYYYGISDWSGLNFADQSLDPLCKMKNCVIRYADAGVYTTSASPSIINCNFNNNNYGVKATGASNPSFVNCDFSENASYAIDNVDKSFLISAANCWWGSNAGPILSDTSPTVTADQQYVTSDVDYNPWQTMGSINPIMGDVSLNGLVQAYDASLVLKYAVGLITLNDTQKQVADVSGSAGITAYDASLILQYVVGMNTTFPINKVKKQAVELTDIGLSVGSTGVNDQNEFTVPVSIANVTGITGADIKLRFNPMYLQAEEVLNLLSSSDMEFNIDNVKGILSIAIARSVSLSSSDALMTLKFKSIALESTVTSIIVDQFLANEQDFTNDAVPGSVSIINSISGLSPVLKDMTQGMGPVYPNPFVDEASLVYKLDDSSKWVDLEIFNLLGQKVANLMNTTQGKGIYTIQLNNKGFSLEPGIYVLRMQTANYMQSQQFQVRK